MSERELDRLRDEYRVRDAAAETPYRWDNPGYVSYMQIVERELLRGLADAGVELAGARVLDVGCGGGYFLHRLSEYGAGECHGIDLMESRIEDARQRYPGLAWHVGSATKLPFEDGSFELVTQFTCLSSIVDDAARSAAASEMRRVAGGGWILSLDLRAAGGSRRRDANGRPRRGLAPQAFRRAAPPPARRAQVRPRTDRREALLRRAVARLAPAAAQPRAGALER